MAKKARAPAPPKKRPVQAPKVRTKDGRARPSALLLAIAGSGVLALVAVIVALVVATGGGGGRGADQGVTAALRAAGCTVTSREPPPFTSNHSLVPSLNTPMKKFWNTFPPAAGAHYGLYAVWGFYREPVNPRMVVHNEEHGATVLWWGPKTPAATVDRLEQFYQESPVSMFGTPIEGLGSKVAITTWSGSPSTYFRNGDYGLGISAVCPKLTDKTLGAFAKFRDKYRGRGPELPFQTAMTINTPGRGPSG